MTISATVPPAPAGSPLVNLRDLGGLPTTDGRRVRQGLLYRSAAPFDLTESGAAALAAELGLGLIVDLRSQGERDTVPWPTLPAAVRLSAVELATRQGRSAQAGHAGPTAWPSPFGPREFGLWYAVIAEQGASRLAALVQLFAQEDTAPALVHCTAGKDRTGIVAACVLDLLGAADDTIVADYTRTQHALDAIRARTTAVLPGLADTAVPPVIMQAEALTMRTFLDEFKVRHGGFAPLLARHGLTAADHAALRKRLLEG